MLFIHLFIVMQVVFTIIHTYIYIMNFSKGAFQCQRLMYNRQKSDKMTNITNSNNLKCKNLPQIYFIIINTVKMQKYIKISKQQQQ